MAALEHDEQLFSTLVADGKRDTSGLCRNSHWLPYAERIEREIRLGGLANFRTNYRLLKGFAVGGVPLPTEPQRRLKRAVWRTLEALPALRRIIAEYRHLNAAAYRENRTWRQALAELCFDAIRQDFPSLRVVEGTANGGADDAFAKDDVALSAQWIVYLARTADFYRRVPAASVRSLLEIGPGMGLNTLAHVALNPHLAVVVNCDLPPVLYLSTQFLKSIETVRVVDYTACAGRDTIGVHKEGQGDGRCTIYQIPPWKLEAMAGQFDYFLNSFSFQEMELDLIKSYIALVAPKIAGGAYVHAYDSAEAPRAGVMKTAATRSYVTDCLASHGLREVPFEARYWPRYWRGDPSMCLLMQR